MATQAQGKGKKKNKEVMKISIDEFNQIDAPHGHSVLNLKMTGLDWAETMADYDLQSTETQQIIVPTAPRAQRGPAIEYDSLPDEPPFRVSIFNLPISVEEKELQDRFFKDVQVSKIDIQKSSTTVELASKQDLYEALSKDGMNCKGRNVNVCLFGQTPPQNNYGSDRYGSRGGFGGSRGGERYGDRDRPGGFGDRDRSTGYGDRDRAGGYGRDREGYGGYNRPSYNQRGGYGDRYNDNRNNFRDSNRSNFTSGGGEPEAEEPTNWRSGPPVRQPVPSFNNGSRSYAHSRHEPPQHHRQQTSPAPSNRQYHQSDHYYQPRGQHHQGPPPSGRPHQFNNQPGSNNRPLPSSSVEERPKLQLKKRDAPLNPEDLTAVSRNEAIFGKAKPSDTPYKKMQEVEDRLKSVHLGDQPRK